MFTIEWLSQDKAIGRDVCHAEEIDVAKGKAFGRAIYLTRKKAEAPTGYRILDEAGHQVAAGEFPADMGGWEKDVTGTNGAVTSASRAG